jgi:hypothetical protein
MTAPHDIDMVQAANELRHHAPPDERTADAHELARSTVFAALALLAAFVPAGRDKSLMKTHLEDALMRANRAIAVNEGPIPQADIQALAESLNRVLGDWVHLGWSPVNDPTAEELEAAGEVAGKGLRSERMKDIVGRALGAYGMTRAGGVSENEAFAVEVAVQSVIRDLGTTKTEGSSAEATARAFQDLLVTGTATGTMVPTAINQPWESVEGAWRNTLVAVFSDLYGQGTIR